MRRIVVGPVDEAAAVVPDILTPYRHRIPLPDRDTRSEILVMGDENREIVGNSHDEPLMPRPFVVIGEEARHAAMRVDLDSRCVRQRCRQEREIGGARTRRCNG